MRREKLSAIRHEKTVPIAACWRSTTSTAEREQLPPVDRHGHRHVATWYETVTIDRGPARACAVNDPVVNGEGPGRQGREVASAGRRRSHTTARGSRPVGRARDGDRSPKVGDPNALLHTAGQHASRGGETGHPPATVSAGEDSLYRRDPDRPGLTSVTERKRLPPVNVIRWRTCTTSMSGRCSRPAEARRAST